MHWLKRTLLILLAIALIGAVALAFRPKPVSVDVAEITRGRFEQGVEEDGKTRVRDRYAIYAPVSGHAD